MAKILVADENSDDADELAAALRRHGYLVRAAYSEQHCLKLIDEFCPGIVLDFLNADLGKKAIRLKKPVDVRSVLRTVADAMPG